MPEEYQSDEILDFEQLEQKARNIFVNTVKRSVSSNALVI